MDTIKNLQALIKKQSEEIEQKNKYIERLEKQIEFESKYNSDEWIHAENFYNEINEAQAIKKRYEQAYKDILELKSRYLGLVQEMIDEF